MSLSQMKLSTKIANLCIHCGEALIKINSVDWVHQNRETHCQEPVSVSHLYGYLEMRDQEIYGLYKELDTYKTNAKRLLKKITHLGEEITELKQKLDLIAKF